MSRLAIDRGASLAVWCGDELVVDLWGGVADRASGRGWAADTLCLIFSGTKALVATCLLMLIDRGTLRLEEPVGRRWPAFASAGKERVLVSELLSRLVAVPAQVGALVVGGVVSGPVAAVGDRGCAHVQALGREGGDHCVDCVGVHRA